MNRCMRVLTLNCWNVSEPFAARMALIRAGIAALQPDLIGLQEIVVRRDGFDQGARILDGLGYHCVYGAAFRWSEAGTVLPHDGDGDAFGNLIAARWPIGRSAVQPLPGAEIGERRSAVAALVQTPEGSVPFITTHLNWKFHQGAVRERQVVALADFMHEWARGSAFPPIVVGDLNAEPDSTEVRFLGGLTSLDGRRTYLQDAWRVAGDGGPGFTWDNRNPFAAMAYEPNRRIDYILVGLADPVRNGRGGIEAARLALHEPTDGVYPSDHFGLLADVRI
jgi:endonuclease/exonuclease/phosphatase family metal-dependent hydrolase